MARNWLWSRGTGTVATCSLAVCPPDRQSLGLLQDLFRHAYYADRQFHWEDWLQADSELQALLATNGQEQVVGALMLQIEERPRALPPALPNRIFGRGLAVADVPQAGAMVRVLLQQGCAFLCRQGLAGQLWLTSNLSWLRQGAVLAGFEEVDRIRYLHRAVRVADRPARALQVRAVTDAEMALVAARDVETFDTPWHMGEKELRKWARQGTLQVLTHGSEVRGYVLVTLPTELPPHVSPFGFIVRLAVWPEFQRQGLGTRLLEAAMCWLADQGIRRVQLNVLASDHRARRFYAQHGFRTTRRPHVILRRNIPVAPL